MKQNKNRLSFQAHLSRHPHDVSAGYTSSLTTGCIVPQYFDILQPGDKMKFKTHMFARFQDVVTAFLGEVDIHVDYFFVPMQMIYTPFGQIFAQTNDVLSSQLKALGSKDTFPLLSPESYWVHKNQDKLSGHIECWGKELVRLLDGLDLNPYQVVGDDCRHASSFIPAEDDPALLDDAICRNPNIAPWALAAYQAIYQKFYRNEEFERFDITAYNIDQYYQADLFVNDTFLTLRYVQRPKDYFTQLRPSPIASAVDKLSSDSYYTQFPSNGSVFSGLFLSVNNYLGVGFPSQDLRAVQKVDNASLPNINNVTATELGGAASPANSLLSVPNIRAAFALDKFLRIYGRAGKTYDDQILAHFGVEIPHDVKHDLTHIKHYRVVVQSDPVYGTATIGTDTGSVLGQVGGQAQGSIDTDEESFTAPVHGVFMAVAYAVTKPRYFGTFNKLHLLDSRIKFPIPEFDKLGAQPLYSFEATPWLLATYTYGDESEFVSAVTNSFRCGWQNRYAEFKKKYNRVSINYAPSWYFGSGQDFEQQTNDFMPWVLTRAPYGNMQLDDDDIHNVWAEEFFERPDALNSVMAVEYNPDWSRDYYFAPHLINQTDPLITEFFCDATKISWMSETGDPDL